MNSLFSKFLHFTLQPQVIRQSILQDDQEDDVFQGISIFVVLVTPISVRIKQYISKWIAFLYLIQMGLGAIGFSYDVKNFYFALYIFSILAQLIASHLVKLEFTMKEQQTIWAHRIFWPFQSLFLFLRLIPGNNLFMRLFVIFQFLPSLVLMAYSIYKPNDRSQLSYETPRFIKELFRSLDDIEFLKQQQQQELFLINPNKYRKKQSISAKDHIDELYKMVGRPSQKEQETYLISQLPTRSVEIQKKFVKKFINDNEILYFYKIDTTINQKVFKSEKRYPEFVTLERQQQEKLEKLKMENIKMAKIEMKPGEDDTSFVIRRGVILQDWLAKQLEDPNQITKNLLDFLNVDDRGAQPFNIYQTVIQKKYTQPKLQQKPVDIEMGNVSVRKDPDIMSLSSEKDYSKLYIMANCTGFEYGQYGSNSVDFVITVSYNVQNERQKQRILRTFSQFKESLEKIEQQMGIPVPIKITQALLKLPNQGKVAFIDKGLKQLIDQHFFCEELIELLGIEI
ncbi:hypothetical protein pb186bvf_007383 [Paramecium bursaria]